MKIDSQNGGLFMPPGHYYSPIPGEEDIARYRNQRARPLPQNLPGIQLDVETLRGNLEAMIREYRDFPEFPRTPTPGLRYFSDNPEHWYQDAISTRHFVMQSQPQQVVEIGAGYSSAIMLDTVDALALETRFTFIEPDPGARLYQLLTPADRARHSVRVEPVQDTPLAIFSSLRPNDILFIDSSHVSKAASDVNWYMFEILPILTPGVLIHIHDINYPFEWPEHLVARAWNEPYLLHAFLMYNRAFTILGWNAYYSLMMTPQVLQMPLCVKWPGGSFWMRKES